MIDDLIVYQKTYDFLLWVKPTVQRFQKKTQVNDLNKENIKLKNCANSSKDFGQYKECVNK